MSAETIAHEPAPAPAEPVRETPETPLAATPVIEARACPNCGSAMLLEQEWCLECGAARPNRRTGMPGWRSGAAVALTTGVLACGAAAAAYAGLKGDSAAVREQQAQARAQAAAAAAATPPPAAPAATVPPPAPVAPSAATPPAVAAPPATPPPAAKVPAPAPAATPAPAPTPAPAAKAPAAKQPAPVKSAKLVRFTLAKDAAATYNPFAHPDTEFTDPKLAIDGDPATQWTAAVETGKESDVGAGLTLDLGKLVGIRALDIDTSTPGVTIEVYGTRHAKPPAKPDDAAWTPLATQLDVDPHQRIVLGDGATQYRTILVYVTEAPPGATQVALGEIKTYR